MPALTIVISSFYITAYFGIAYKMLASNFPKIVYRCVVNIEKRLDYSPNTIQQIRLVASSNCFDMIVHHYLARSSYDR